MQRVITTGVKIWLHHHEQLERHRCYLEKDRRFAPEFPESGKHLEHHAIFLRQRAACDFPFRRIENARLSLDGCPSGFPRASLGVSCTRGFARMRFTFPEAACVTT
jgi:hypothetical protein